MAARGQSPPGTGSAVEESEVVGVWGRRSAHTQQERLRRHICCCRRSCECSVGTRLPPRRRQGLKTMDLGSSSSSSSSSDSAPDCWDQVDMEAPGLALSGDRAFLALAAAAAEVQHEPLSSAFSRQLNINAKPFVRNVHAAEFTFGVGVQT